MEILIYAQIDTKYGNDEDLNPIEKFIYEHEQVAHQEDLFCKHLIDALHFAINEIRFDNCGTKILFPAIENNIYCNECYNEITKGGMSSF